MRAPGLAVASILVAIMGACSDDTFSDTIPACLPASTAACFCPTGAPGAKVCTDTGLEYGACACLPDAGLDAAPPVDAAVAVDGPLVH